MTHSPVEVEVEALIHDLLPFVRKMLAMHGEFLPFGGFTRSDGSVVHAGALDPATDGPRSSDLIGMLSEDLRERARNREIRVAAIVYLVEVRSPHDGAKVDAVQVEVEHQDSYCANVFFPYRLDESGSPVFGEAFAQQGRRSVFLD